MSNENTINKNRLLFIAEELVILSLAISMIIML
jgi:hypothetical protein